MPNKSLIRILAPLLLALCCVAGLLLLGVKAVSSASEEPQPLTLLAAGEAYSWSALPIPSPQYPLEPFTIIVLALDQLGQRAAFTGTATLTDTTGTIVPTTVSVVNGEGTADVVISAWLMMNVTITVSGEGLVPFTTNPFDVWT